MSNTTSVSSTASAPVPYPAVLDTMIRVIMSQTEMTEEETKTALERTNYDLKRVIREYMLGDSTSTSNSITNVSNNHTATSTNQLRFSEIRNFMDKSAEQYYRRQEMAKIYNQVLERKKAEAEAAAAASRAGETSTEVQPTNTHPEPESKL